ncbi:MAG TPA: hypothetical protein H9669_04295, partial [Firmicutes bacterium]|nr:hypothetical protein [Bacillota bacterium]
IHRGSAPRDAHKLYCSVPKDQLLKYTTSPSLCQVLSTNFCLNFFSNSFFSFGFHKNKTKANHSAFALSITLPFQSTGINLTIY